MPRILVLHGPNLNLLGQREQAIYGSATLQEINSEMAKLAEPEGFLVEARQSNHEGDLIGWIQEAPGHAEALVINPAGYTHTSVAIRDAILAVGLPTVEVHLSNIYRREAFRRKSLIAGVALGQISGFGVSSYLLAIKAVIDYMKQSPSTTHKTENIRMPVR